MRKRAHRATAFFVLAVLTASGCAVHGDSRTRAARPQPIPTTARTAPLLARAALEPCPASKAARGKLPDVVLPCLDGSREVRIAHLQGPAVVNLWASWCRPCAAELPLLAGVARAGRGRVLFLGVDTGDDPDSALREVAETRVRYPSVYDRQRQVADRLGVPGLPVTALIRTDGTIAYTKLGPIGSEAQLRMLIQTHLGVPV